MIIILFESTFLFVLFKHVFVCYKRKKHKQEYNPLEFLNLNQSLNPECILYPCCTYVQNCQTYSFIYTTLAHETHLPRDLDEQLLFSIIIFYLLVKTKNVQTADAFFGFFWYFFFIGLKCFSFFEILQYFLFNNVIKRKKNLLKLVNNLNCLYLNKPALHMFLYSLILVKCNLNFIYKPIIYKFVTCIFFYILQLSYFWLVSLFLSAYCSRPILKTLITLYFPNII